METKEMTPSESLHIISSYINESRKDFVKANGAPMILWGCVLMSVSLLVFVLWHYTGNPAWNFGWFAIPVIGGILSLIIVKHEKHIPKNIVNTVVGWTWGIFGIVSVIFAIAVLAISFRSPEWTVSHNDIISVGILLLLGFAEAVTGAVLGKKWIIVLGIAVSLVLSLVVTVICAEFMPIIMAAAGFLSLFLPGIIIRSK